MTIGGFSSQRLTRVRDVLERTVESGFVPGAVAAVARRGQAQIETAGTLAVAGPGARTPMAADTIFRVASMSKPIVAACAMTLVEDGTLRLDDPVDEFLPELADMRVLADPDGPLEHTVPARRAITLRDLLTFTFGTGMVLGEPGSVPIVDALADLQRVQEGTGDEVPGEWLGRLGSLPLVFQPGERWLYETAADVTGLLIARATGGTFADAVRERICAPLGMSDTAFWVEAGNIGRLATAYQWDDAAGQLAVDDEPEGNWSRPPAFEGGGGGLVSTALDYLGFASSLLYDNILGRARVLSRPSVTLMTTDQLTSAQRAVAGLHPGDFDDIGWGFGMSVRTRRTQLGPSVGSYGWPGVYGTAWYNDPAEDLTLVLLMQRKASPGALTVFLDLCTAVYQAIDE